MFSIGSVHIPNRLVLAPLAGYSDLPFRMVCREYGAGLCVSEMISSHGLVYQQHKTRELLQSSPEDTPLAYQLFGADPEIMAEAAAVLNDFSPDLIDINMGCPVKKVTKRGAGAALMADLKRAEQIIAGVVRSSHYPVTLKMRSGPDQQNRNGEILARIAEDNGVSALVVHGRTWKQAFGGKADWTIVEKIKTSVSIPVIGNGDIGSFQEARFRLETSRCDAVMIGRAAFGNPWVFDPDGRPGDLNAVIEALRHHIFLLESFNDSPQLKLAAIKNHLGKYFKGFSGAGAIRKTIYETTGWQNLKDFLNQLQTSVTSQSTAGSPASTSCR
jgi:tRNA-dihydrouridine synthase B